jgi:hypothetical protein
MRATHILLAAAMLGPAVPAAAEPPERTTSVVVYGDDPCPKGDDGEVVVCGRRPETERYRIPKELRNKDDPPSEVSWGARNDLLEQAGRELLPGSCSVNGSYGQSGCHNKLIQQWYDNRRERRR